MIPVERGFHPAVGKERTIDNPMSH